MKIRFFLAAILLTSVAARARASAPGQDPFNFLFIDAGARPAAMGGAYTALADDSNALQYNPGALGMVKRTEATFMYDDYVQTISQEYAGLAAQNGLGFNLNALDFGSVPRTTINNPGGAGDSTGLNDLALSAGYGHKILDSLSVGGAVKYIRESIDASSARAFALDAGALYRVPCVSGLTLGAALQNLGEPATFVTSREPLPLNVRLGSAYQFAVLGRQNAVSLDLTKERTQAVQLKIGAESRVIDVLPLRIGFTTANDAGPGITAGFGYVRGRASFDYAIAPYGELGMTHRISVTLRFGDDAPAQKTARLIPPPQVNPPPTPAVP